MVWIRKKFLFSITGSRVIDLKDTFEKTLFRPFCRGIIITVLFRPCMLDKEGNCRKIKFPLCALVINDG